MKRGVIKMKRTTVKPINCTTIVEGKFAEEVRKQANTSPSKNFKNRSKNASILLKKLKG